MRIAAAVPLLCAALLWAAPPASADAERSHASVSTLITTPLAIEGLTNDDDGNVYAPGRNAGPGAPCPVWRVSLANPALAVVGFVPAPASTATPLPQCSPSGLAFGPDGKLYVTETDRIYRFTPDATTPPTGELFASGVPGTNGLAFDRRGNLWTGDGTTGQGRVWKITPQGMVTEALRVQPMATSGANVVGREVRTIPANTSQPLVANGLAFNRRGDLFIADTARGAIWQVRFRSDGSVVSTMGCDAAFAANTLCMENVFVAHPLLEGADGFLLDVAGNFWVAANERNALVYVQAGGFVVEAFRNPIDAVTGLRNAGPLETPTSPVLAGHRLCTANSDGGRRDNAPASAGEIGGAGQPKGKISCIDQRVSVPGMRLPVN